MSTFHPFPRLPIEVQRQIWKAAVPPDFGRCVFPWRPGCWTVRSVPDANPDSDPDSDSDEDAPKCVEYSTAALGHIEIPLPMVQVNREASQVAREWIQRNNVDSTPQSRIRLVATPQGPVARRGFDYRRDALLIPAAQWERFMKELDEWNADYDDITVDEELESIVVTEEAFDRDWTDIFLYQGVTKVSVLRRGDEVRGKDEGWWREMYAARPMQRWCEVGTHEEYTVMVPGYRETCWRKLDTEFKVVAERVFEDVGSAIRKSSRRPVEFFKGAWLCVKEV
ncbi:hypothetical protein QBC34DRAFT_103291 [Podospora aff. communis PSN243]|uniref:2EXR domain-containing protein n=1 Tax=Podospora aff. communis PSN243 TaxID=3040156 RepID=A0AAV9H4F1_9PEZI|nr:hypothetical protein QBC34DRAFT_103291 [Podospora aff. communis PSN243]